MNKIFKVIIAIVLITAFSLIRSYYQQKKNVGQTNEKENLQAELYNDVKETKRVLNQCEFKTDKKNQVITKPVLYKDKMNIIQISSYKADGIIGMSFMFTTKKEIEFSKGKFVTLETESQKKMTFKIAEIAKSQKHKESGMIINTVFGTWENPNIENLKKLSFNKVNIQYPNGNFEIPITDKGELIRQLKCVYY